MVSVCRLYAGIAKEFVRAEQSEDWDGHLAALGKMLNIFAKTGHINYAKSGRLYLQLMIDLEKDFPWLYQQFQEKGFILLGEPISFGLVYEQI